MHDNNNKANEQNIAEVLEMLRQSYKEKQDPDALTEFSDESLAISEDELKKKLRMQFSSESNVESDFENNSYNIDADFLDEAEQVEEIETVYEQAQEVLDAEAEQIVEESQEVDIAPWEDAEADDVIVEAEQTAVVELHEEINEIDELQEDEYIEDVEYIEEAELVTESEYDDDITFDELETIESDDDIILSKLVLEDNLTLSDDEVAFDDLEQLDTTNDNLVFARLESEEGHACTLKTILFDEQFSAGVSREELELVEDDGVEDAVEEISATETKSEDDDFLSEFFANETGFEVKREDSVVLDAFANNTENNTLDSADMSLLMQFGCDADELNKYAAVNEAFVKKEENSKESEEKQKQDRRAKILAAHEKYTQRRGNVFFRMIISGVFLLVLFFYDALPIFGVELPGILNRHDYFISYLLLGFQVAALCLLPSYKQIWKGAKRLLSRRPDAYSILVAVAGTIMLYDFALLFVVDGSNPPMFHFALACIMMLTLVLELENITTEKRCFEMFFFDELDEEVKVTSKFTLFKSEGKNSTAQKMYDGGVTKNKVVYAPFEIKDTESALNVLKRRSKRRELPMLAFIPSLAFSFVMWLVALIIYGQIWLAFCSMITTLLFTLPIVGVFCAFLPFERFSAKGKATGYAFASQVSMEEYSDSDVMIFKDMHLFSKVEASNVNMVFYDATTKDVLMGCLDAVYSEIGGPMENTFSRGAKKRFDKCRIDRVAKNGVEAVVQNNYSVLIGNEQFMARYGISFPNVSLSREDDKIFTLCVSINGRATARFAVRYTVNEMFYMFSKRLWEDGISCAVETFDPMVSSELVARVMAKKQAPISIIHLNVNNLEEKKFKDRDKFLFGVEDRELNVISLTSRLNLAVALCDAKRMNRMIKMANLLSIGLCVLGAIIAFLFAFFKISEYVNELYILLYWIAGIGGFVGLVFGMLPKATRFSFEDFKAEQAMNAMPKTQFRKS